MNESFGADVPEPGNRPPRDQDAWVQAVLDAAVEGMMIIDERGIVQSINPAATSIFGYAREEVVGNNVNMLMASPFREAHDGYLEQYRETGQRHVIGTGREVVGRRKDGGEVPLELSVSEVDLGQRVFIGTLRDLTERRRAERRARQHEAELAHIGRINLMGEMATGIAHELNQPLAAIAAFASACKMKALAESDPPGSTLDNTVELLDQIDEQTHCAAEIIRRLRRLVRKSEPHRSTVTVGAMVLDSISLIDADARLKNVEIISDLGENLPVRNRRSHSNRVGSPEPPSQRGGGDGRQFPANRFRLYPIDGVADDRSGSMRHRRGPDRRGIIQGLQGVFHDQTRRHGHGAGHLPIHHRGPRRQVDRRPRRRRWGIVSVHVADG